MTEFAELTADGATAGTWVLDPAGSRADFYVRHFWGAITVHGWFERMAGEGAVAADGSAAGTITIDADSLSTRNKQRDKHLRSADFFDVANHPQVVITVTDATPDEAGIVACAGTVAAAGRTQPVEFTAQVAKDGSAAVLTAELTIDRTGFGMTWSPMKIASYTTRATLTARFTRR